MRLASANASRSSRRRNLNFCFRAGSSHSSRSRSKSLESHIPTLLSDKHKIDDIMIKENLDKIDEVKFVKVNVGSKTSHKLPPKIPQRNPPEQAV